jgi:acyl dehydratase
VAKTFINGNADLVNWVGKELPPTDWYTVTQEMINKFAEATGDHQWIHVDVERAKRESPYKTPIAHGFLTLSLIPVLRGLAVDMPKARLGINYGLNKVRFTGPVPAGARVRAVHKLLKVEDLPDNGTQQTWQVTIYCEGSDKPVLIAENIGRRFE